MSKAHCDKMNVVPLVKCGLYTCSHLILASCYSTMSYCLLFVLALSQFTSAQSPSATTSATLSTPSGANADVVNFGQKINVLGSV
jgi:hypothetical protein